MLCSFNASNQSLQKIFLLTWIVYATKQRIAPIQSNMAKPENKHLQNLTHSGVVGGGVKALGPYCSKLALAWDPVKPLLTSVPNLLQSSGIGTLWTSNSSSCLRLSIRALSENILNVWYFLKSLQCNLSNRFYLLSFFRTPSWTDSVGNPTHDEQMRNLGDKSWLEHCCQALHVTFLANRVAFTCTKYFWKQDA